MENEHKWTWKTHMKRSCKVMENHFQCSVCASSLLLRFLVLFMYLMQLTNDVDRNSHIAICVRHRSKAL